jgi:HAD superfamily hydrolase (TIGR01549 family)
MGSSLKKYKYIIFDFDGTLANLSVDWKGLKKKLAQTFNKDFTKLNEGLKNLTENELKRAFKIIEKYELKAKYELNCSLIEYVKENDKIYAIFSDNMSVTVKNILEKAGIINKFHVVLCKDNVAKFKPDIEGLKKILETLNVYNKTEVIFIGNDEKDKLIAENVGIDFMDVKDFTN